MKKKRGLIIAVALVLAFGSGVIAKNVFDIIKAEVRTDFVVEIDGVERIFKDVNGERVYPILHNGTTYLPVRAIGEIMNKDVYWYEDEKRIELKDKETTTVTDADVIVSDNNTQKVVETDQIDVEKAKEIALNKAGLKESDVSFVKAELDYEKGVAVYEIEFRQGFKEYNAEIKASDGTILEWDVDIDD